MRQQMGILNYIKLQCVRRRILILFQMQAQIVRSCSHDRLFLVGRRAGVVFVAPGNVPQTGDEARGDKDDRSVVDGVDIDGDDGRHAEQRHSEDGPG